MNYFHGRQKRSKASTAVVVIVLIALAFVVWLVLNSTSNSLVLRPILNLQVKVSDFIDDRYYFLQTKSSLLEENRQLKDQLASIESTRLVNQVLRTENTELRSILNRIDDRQPTLASVLLGPDTSIYDTLLIDVGTETGIEKNDLVLAYGNIPIGQVIETGLNSSKVLLFSSAGQTTQVRLREAGILAEAVGRGHGNFELTLPRDIEIEEKEVIVLPNLDPLILGELGQIISDPKEPSQRILFNSPINANQLQWVQIQTDQSEF